MHTYTWKVVISSGLVTPETLCSLRISDSIPSNMPLTHTSSAHSSYTFMFRSRLRASRCHCEKRFADSAQQRSWLASIDATRVNEENLVDCQIVDIFSLSSHSVITVIAAVAAASSHSLFHHFFSAILLSSWPPFRNVSCFARQLSLILTIMTSAFMTILTPTIYLTEEDVNGILRMVLDLRCHTCASKVNAIKWIL